MWRTLRIWQWLPLFRTEITGQVLQVASNYLTPQVGKPVRRNEARSLAIYPNPAIDQLYVNLGSGQEYNGQIKITDLSGKIVMTVDVQPGISLYQLDVAHLSRGMYMIYLMEAGEMKGTKKSGDNPLIRLLPEVPVQTPVPV